MVLVAALGAPALPSAILGGTIVTDDGMPLSKGTSAVLRCGESATRPIEIDVEGRFSLDASAIDGSCAVVAGHPGYVAQPVAVRDLAVDPRIPAITLFRLNQDQGEAISPSHLAAPPAARKSYHAAIRTMRDPDSADAAQILERLRHAVDAYPGYAPAWFEIGRLHLALGNSTAAIRALRRAVEADVWFISPYQPLLLLLRATADTHGATEVCDGLRRINPYLPEDCLGP